MPKAGFLVHKNPKDSCKVFYPASSGPVVSQGSRIAVAHEFVLQITKVHDQAHNIYKFIQHAYSVCDHVLLV